MLGRLAATLYFSEPAERRVTVAREAVAMARRVGDPRALGQALHELHFALLEPDALAERLAVVEELGALARTSSDGEVRARSLLARVLSSLEIGDRGALDVALGAQARARGGSCAIPICRGRRESGQRCACCSPVALDEADLCVHEALREGRRIQRELAPQWYAVQIYQLRREQGRLSELTPDAPADHRPPIRQSIPGPPRWRCSRQKKAAATRRCDVRARSVPGGIEQVRRDVNRVITLAVLAELAFAVA